LQLLNEMILSMMVRWDNVFAHDEEDENGQTMIEYGLIVALISIVAILTLTTVGGNIKNVFSSIAGKLHS
jgi:pilus assembly protein Flp/PilA